MKFTIFLILFSFGAILNGEQYQDYLNHFENTLPYTNFRFANAKNDDSTIINDIINAVEESGIHIFSVIRKTPSAFTSALEIYCSGRQTFEYILNHFEIQEGVYRGLFVGKTSVNFYPLEDLNVRNPTTTFLLIGDEENVFEFKTLLSSKYDSGAVNPGFLSNEEQNILSTIYFVVGAVLVLLTGYDILFQKKEFFLRFSFGESRMLLFTKNIMIDSVCILVISSGSIYVLSYITTAMFQYRLASRFIIVIIFVNLLFYLSLFKFDVKQAFSRNIGSSGLLAGNYFIKFVTLLLTVISISSNLIFIEQAISYHRQKEFFKKYSAYNYIEAFYNWDYFNGREDEDIEKYIKDHHLREAFYRDFFHSADISIIANITGSDDKYPSIYANKNMAPYIIQQIPELKEKITEEKIYLIFPQKASKKYYFPELVDEFKEYTYVEYNFSTEVITYSSNARLVMLDYMLPFFSELIKNPIIVLNNIDESKKPYALDYKDFGNTGYFYPETLQKISREEFISYAKNYGFDPDADTLTVTNAYDLYNRYLTIINRSCMINTVLCVLIFLLDSIILSVLIRLEYKMNAVSYINKKILGYSLLQRNKNILFLIIISSVSGLLSALTINVFIQMTSWYWLILAAVLVSLIEIGCFLFNAHKIEKMNIANALKGADL